MINEKDATNATLALTVLWGLGNLVGISIGNANLLGIGVPLIVGALGLVALYLRKQHKMI